MYLHTLDYGSIVMLVYITAYIYIATILLRVGTDISVVYALLYLCAIQL